jgi:hypothetical protein
VLEGDCRRILCQVKAGKARRRRRTEVRRTEPRPQPDAELAQKARQGASVKRESAQGGCLGTSRRRRTWQAAKSLGELQASVDPGVSEWGNPAEVVLRHLLAEEPTQGTETSQYLEEKKSTEIPEVAASEPGRAQTGGGQTSSGLRGLRETDRKRSGRCLERHATEGESPVGETRVGRRWGTRVGRGTRNPGRIRGDHPPRLNTSS